MIRPHYAYMQNILVIAFLACAQLSLAQRGTSFNIIAYYSAGADKVADIPAEKLSHIIYSFCHLNGNELTVDNAEDSLTIRKLVDLKKINPRLKILVSLGGWGGCKSCSDVFSTEEARLQFAKSVLVLNQLYGTDGIDLDWEYPAIEGYPEHPFKAEDKENFTSLISVLRSTFGNQYELSFAAGGFQKYLEESIEWDTVMTLVDRVNVMSYDLVGGYATVTGHHTPLYSSKQQKESTDNAVRYLLGIGVPRAKIVIGAAFYARVWENVSSQNNGLHQSGKFKRGVNYRNFASDLSGFDLYWDNEANARYGYNPQAKQFATFDDKRSIMLKTEYAIGNGLGGIMFWELSLDQLKDGLLDTIYRATIDHKF